MKTVYIIKILIISSFIQLSYFSFSNPSQGNDSSLKYQNSGNGDNSNVLPIKSLISDSNNNNHSINSPKDNNNSFELGGYVYANSVGIYNTTVYILFMDSTGKYQVKELVKTDSSGYYLFRNIPGGDYILKAVPDDIQGKSLNLIPSYSGNVIFWNQAVHLKPVSNSYTNNIILVKSSYIQGTGSIQGQVVRNMSDFPNIQVMLLNLDDSPVSCDFSDPNGNFSFDNLSFKTYKVYVEITGIKTYPALVTLNEKCPVMQNILLETVSGIYSSIDNNLLERKLFPNPANDMTRINIHNNGGQTNKLQVSIYDLSGQQIKTIPYSSFNNSDIEITISLQDIPHGTYMVYITENDKITVVNKLMVIK